MSKQSILLLLAYKELGLAITFFQILFLLFLSSWLFFGNLILTTVIWDKRSSVETLAFIGLAFEPDFGGIFLLRD